MVILLARICGLNDFVGYQGEKGIFSGVEKPAKMSQAGTAGGILPVISGKPAELAGGFSLDQAAGCLAETLDLKRPSRWVKKGMLMLPVYAYSLLVIGNCSTALTAD